MMPSEQQKKEFYIVFLTALIVRLSYWVFARFNYFFYGHPSSDVIYYQLWAQEISRMDFIGTKAFWGLPLYPYFLAFLDRICLGYLPLIRFFHLLIGSLNCVLIALIADKLFQRKVALWSGLLAAVYFPLFFYDWLMMPVTLNILMSALIIVLLLNQEELNQLWHWFLLGSLMGLAVLGDGKILFFTFFIIIYHIFQANSSQRKMMLVKGCLLLMGCILVVSSIGWRNKKVSGDWIWISAQKGLSLFVGNNPDAKGYYEHPSFLRPDHRGQDEDAVIYAERQLQRRLTPKQVSDYWQNKALQFITQQPRDYLSLLSKKMILFFSESENTYDMDMLLQADWKNRLEFNFYWLLIPLGLLGLWLARGQTGTAYLSLMILSQLLFTLIFFIQYRHRLTIIPFLIIFEVYCIQVGIEQWKAGQRKFILPVVGLILFYLVFFPKLSIADKKKEYVRATKSGSVYEARQEWVQAQLEYQKALCYDPQDTNALYNLANVHMKQHRYAVAEDIYKDILKINPMHVDAMFNLGVLYEELAFYDKALEIFHSLQNWQPESLDIYLHLAHIYRYQGLCEKAEVYYRVLIQQRPEWQEDVTKFMDMCPRLIDK